eukprot:4753836-Alexandrium_andersonii.AAC.1
MPALRWDSRPRPIRYVMLVPPRPGAFGLECSKLFTVPAACVGLSCRAPRQWSRASSRSPGDACA